MNPLDKYFVGKAVDRLPLPAGIKEAASRLVTLLGLDGSVEVGKALSELFPLNSKAAGKSSLKRLLDSINRSAVEHRIHLAGRLTTGKTKAFPPRIYFEGIPEPPSNTVGQLAVAEASFYNRLALPSCRCLLLLTYNEHETAAVLEQFSTPSSRRTETRHSITYNILDEINGMTIVHRVSKQGESEAQNSTTDGIESWSPEAVISLGIAFGANHHKQRIGDVLVSENIRDYELVRLNPDGGQELRSDKPSCSRSLYQLFSMTDQVTKCDPYWSIRWPTVHFGTLLSGNKLIDNANQKNRFLELEPTAIGGEMEAVGVQKAADRKKVDWITVKAICDWADGNKNSATKAQDQVLAAKNAALVVHRALTLQVESSPDGSRSSAISLPDMGLKDHKRLKAENALHLLKGSFTKLGQKLQVIDSTQTSVDVIDDLFAWLNNSHSPPVYVILGEYGMGKTVMSQHFIDLLSGKQSELDNTPIPLYFDLRLVTKLRERVPNLAETLEECMVRGWQGGDSGPYKFEHILSWMSRGAFLAIDGLDEVLVKLSADDGQVFTRQLLSLVSLSNERGGRSRILITCRDHYFRTIQDQNNHFSGQERCPDLVDSFRAVTLLPLTAQQVKSYLQLVLPTLDPAVCQSIAGSDNFKDLSRRPFSLQMLLEMIPELERKHRKGETLFTVDLYRLMVQRWLDRDAGKHQITPEHKLEVANHLAAYLWRRGQGTLPIGDLEEFVHAWLESRTELKRRYSRSHSDIIEEDLRTATFLTRTSGGDFQFSHTSFLEFFIANYLYIALQDGRRDAWKLPRPSSQTWHFLRELIETGQSSTLRTLEQWLTTYEPESSESIISFVMASAHGPVMEISLQGADFSGAQLGHTVLGSKAKMLDLGGASFQNANLEETVFDNADLTGASFAGAILNRTRFTDCVLTRADFGDSYAAGAVWRKTNLESCRWTGIKGTHLEFIDCQSSPSDLPGATVCPKLNGETIGSAELQWYNDCPDSCFSASWSPCGNYVLVGPDYDALLILDADSLRPLRCFELNSIVRQAIWSPDETLYLLVADFYAYVGGLRQSPKEIRVPFFAKAGAWSPDGSKLILAGHDGCLVYSTSDLKLVAFHRFAAVRQVYGCQWPVTGPRVATADFQADENIEVLDCFDPLQVLAKFRVGKRQLPKYYWAPDGACFAVVTRSDVQFAYSNASSKVFRLNTQSHGAWSSDGKTFALAGGGIIDRETANIRQFSPTVQESISSFAWSPCMTKVFTTGSAAMHLASENSTIKTHRRETSAAPLFSAHCDWSSDSDRFIVSRGSHRLAWHFGKPDSPPTRHIGANSPGQVVCLSSNFELAVVRRPENGVCVQRVSTGVVLTTLPEASPASAFCWSPSSRLVASIERPGEVTVYDSHSGIVVSTSSLSLPPAGPYTSEPFWSPCERFFYVKTHDKAGVILDTLNGQAVREFSLKNEFDSSFGHWSPRGDYFARCSAFGGDVEILDTATYSTVANIRWPLGWSYGGSRCRWAPDGIRLATAGSEPVEIYEGRTGRLLLTMGSNHRGICWDCCWSPDGEFLLTVGADRTARVWNSRTGELERVYLLEAFGEDCYAVWSPASQMIYSAAGAAWRKLFWLKSGAPGDNELHRLPLEYFQSLDALPTEHI